MTKRAQIITAVILAVLIVLAILFSVARSRGIITFTGWRPHFSKAALLNPQPSLDRPIVFPADFPAEAKDIFNAKLQKTKETLLSDPSNVAAWLDLAIDYRMVGDYEGAVQIWKYIHAHYPQEGISLHNLGEHYFHIAKDYPAAEKYYMASIAVAPKLAANYMDLFEMYRYVYKQDTNAAASILTQGIVALNGPGSIDLMIQLGDYYAEKGNTADARSMYQQARTGANTLHNPALVRELDRRISQLK